MIYYFYKIVCDDLPNFVYVGSTMSYANRKYEHKRTCNNENRKGYNYKIYQTIRANGGWDNFRMVCIHQEDVDNKRHAEKIEEDYRLELNGNMNTKRAFTTPEQEKEYRKEYRENNKDIISEKGKEYRKKNKDYISEQNKEWRENNRDYFNEYRQNNKDKISEKKKEYRQNNKDYFNEYFKEYRKKNKDRINQRLGEKIKCECGCEVRRDSLTRHKLSQKHIKLMQNI
jgi:hypothetical protein